MHEDNTVHNPQPFRSDSLRALPAFFPRCRMQAAGQQATSTPCMLQEPLVLESLALSTPAL